MDDKICPIKLLLKVQPNICFKLIDKDSLSIFYPYELEKILDYQMNLLRETANDYLYSILSIIKGDLIIPKDTYFYFNDFEQLSVKDLVIVIKLFMKLINGDKIFYLVHNNNLIRSEQTVFDSDEIFRFHSIFLSICDSMPNPLSFYDLRLIFKLIYPEDYFNLQTVNLTPKAIDELLDFTVDDYSKFVSEFALDIEYFKMLKNFDTQYQQLFFKIKNLINR